jgi:hypothetical protein
LGTRPSPRPSQPRGLGFRIGGEGRRCRWPVAGARQSGCARTAAPPNWLGRSRRHKKSEEQKNKTHPRARRPAPAWPAGCRPGRQSCLTERPAWCTGVVRGRDGERGRDVRRDPAEGVCEGREGGREPGAQSLARPFGRPPQAPACRVPVVCSHTHTARISTPCRQAYTLPVSLYFSACAAASWAPWPDA